LTIRKPAIDALYLGMTVTKDGPFGSCERPARGRSSSPMNDRGLLHRIDDDLSETWIEDWAEHGVQAIECYLAKHLAFLSFLDEASA
jgi:hypothetical protein